MGNRPGIHRGLFAVLGICLWSSVGAGNLRSADSDPDLLHVLETHWGFDGTVQESVFMPFSALVRNVASVPWQGELRLTRTISGQPLGAPIAVDVALQANERRWIQFLPYIVDERDDWILSWGKEPRHRIEMSTLRAGPPPTVLIHDSEAVASPGGVLRRMPEEHFPTTVSATSGLRGVILTHSPFWPGARGQAFLDWLSLGGRVYILHDGNGRFPQFHSPLEVLNDPRNEFRIGQGQVRRIPVKAEEISLEFARREIFNDDWRQSRPPSSTGKSSAVDRSESYWEPDRDLLDELKPLAKFERRWWLIYLTVLAYLAALFPGCYALGVTHRNVRGFYVAFLGTIGLFSLAFLALGQLGGSHQNRIRSVALARSLGDGSFAVSQWSYLANVNAGEYQLRHQGTGRWYSTCQDMEQVEGLLKGGSDASASLLMPTASTNTLRHCNRMALDRPLPRLVEFSREGSRLERLTVSVHGCFAQPISRALAVHAGQVYELKQERGQLVLVQDREHRIVLLEEYLKRPIEWDWGYFGRTYRDEDEIRQSERYERMIRPLVGNSYGLTTKIDPRKLNTDSGTVRLFVMTAMPDEFFDTVGTFPDQQGRVLFCFELRVGE